MPAGDILLVAAIVLACGIGAFRLGEWLVSRPGRRAE